MNEDLLNTIRSGFLKGIFQIENLTTDPNGNTNCEQNQNGNAFREQQVSLPLKPTRIQSAVTSVRNIGQSAVTSVRDGINNILETFSALSDAREEFLHQDDYDGGSKRKHRFTIKKNKLRNKNKTRKH